LSCAAGLAGRAAVAPHAVQVAGQLRAARPGPLGGVDERLAQGHGGRLLQRRQPLLGHRQLHAGVAQLAGQPLALGEQPRGLTGHAGRAVGGRARPGIAGQGGHGIGGRGAEGVRGDMEARGNVRHRRPARRW
jgi:hypothetical protein